LCPRRTILDKLLLDAAVEAGAEVREGFIVEELVFEDGRVVGIKGRTHAGASVEERANIVVGADGRQSLVARAVEASKYHEKPPLMCGYYSYWRGLPMNGRFETYIRPNRGCAAADTHDGLTLVVVGWPNAEFEANKKDVERHYVETIRLAPALSDRLDSATRAAPVAGATIPNFFRKPYGPGWALVGDAGYNKDPITAQGITDAFRDAEHLATALDDVFSGVRSFDEAMSSYQQTRDEHVLSMYEFTCQLATLAPPPPEMQRLFGSIQGNQPAMDRFVQMNAGTISPADFFMAEH
jgi:flavin-dependent dehydrogenase